MQVEKPLPECVDIAVIGGGAAGFFTALNVGNALPGISVAILEKGQKPLTKVKVSGGGRCNVTNGRTKPGELTAFYPRGGKKLHKLLKNFTTQDMRTWLQIRKVPTKIEEDLRVFPESDSSQSIIDCFLEEADRLGILTVYQHGMKDFHKANQGWMIDHPNGQLTARYLIIATGSSPSLYKLLASKGFQMTAPVPSLFTFNIRDPRIDGLMGIAVKDVEVKINSSPFSEKGDLLITHWGMSGPAILKLSSWAARHLHTCDYQFSIRLNFCGMTPEAFKDHLLSNKVQHGQRTVLKHPLCGLPKRLWIQIATHSGVNEGTTYAELSKKAMNKLVEELCQGEYPVKGKSTFKEEFVTCGGIDLSEVHLSTMQSRTHDGLFFAGEVMDIDALTGGFNFQACWSAGHAIAQAILDLEKG